MSIIGKSIAGAISGAIGAASTAAKAVSQNTGKSQSNTSKTQNTYNPISYDRNTDYSKAIQNAINNDADLFKAAQLEQQRNAKIDGENLNYAKTHYYSAFLPGGSAYYSGQAIPITYDKNKDYSEAIQNAVNLEADVYKAALLEQQRNAKIDGENLPYQKTNYYTGFLPGGSMFSSGILGDLATVSKNGTDAKEEWTNPYQNQMDEILAQINNSQFTYDPNNAQAQALKQRYTEAGQQAMENTLAQVSARTGGLASSYAGTTAQQQYNNYMLGLDDSLAALEQQAYQNWLTEQDQKRATLNLMAGLASQAESSYWNQVNYDTNLQQYQDDLAYRTWQQNLAERQQNLTEQQYQDSLTETDRQYAYETAMGILQTGNMPSTDLLTAAGISLQDAQTIANYYRQAMMAATYGGSGSGGGSRSSGSGSSGSSASSGTSILERRNQLFQDAQNSGIGVETYIMNMAKKYGFDDSSNGISALMDEYETWSSQSKGMGPSTFENFQSTVQFYIDRGWEDQLVRYLTANWNRLSPTQQGSTQSLLGKYQIAFEP